MRPDYNFSPIQATFMVEIKIEQLCHSQGGRCGVHSNKQIQSPPPSNEPTINATTCKIELRTRTPILTLIRRRAMLRKTTEAPDPFRRIQTAKRILLLMAGLALFWWLGMLAKAEVERKVPRDSRINKNESDSMAKPQSLYSIQKSILPLLDWEQRSADIFSDIANVIRLNQSNASSSLSTYDFSNKALIQTMCKSTCKSNEVPYKKCCLGDVSTRLTMYNTRWQCVKAMQPQRLKRLEQYTRDYLAKTYATPVPSISSSKNRFKKWTSRRTATIGQNKPLFDSREVVCDICQVLELARQSRLKIAFWGDSVSHQTFFGFLCAAQRRNYTLVEKQLTSKQPHGSRAIHSNKYSFAEVVEGARLRSPMWPVSESVSIRSYLQARLPSINQTETKRVLRFADILVVGFGLHWNDEGQMALDMKQFFAVYHTMLTKRQKRGQHVPRILIHRETSASHWNTPTGNYHPDIEAHLCRPHQSSFTTTSSLPFQERALRQAATSNGYQIMNAESSDSPHRKTRNTNKHRNWKTMSSNITFAGDELWVIPFYNYTKDLYDMHPHRRNLGGSDWLEKEDCTHFCSSPFLWMPIWKGLRRIMDANIQ